MTQLTLPAGMQITGDIKPGYETILVPEALALVAKLTREFEPRRQQLLAVRVERAKKLDAGERPDFLAETAHIRAGDWKIAADLSTSHARRGSAWRDLRQSAFNVPVTWSFPGDEVQNYSVGIDSGKASNFGAPSLYVDNDGHVKDKLNAVSLSASRPVDSSIVSRIKVGVRATDREKSYHQTTWTLNSTGIPASAYETINVDGYPAFFGLKDWDSTIASAFGPNAFNPNGQKQEDWQIQNDALAGWKVKERSSSALRLAASALLPHSVADLMSSWWSRSSRRRLPMVSAIADSASAMLFV